MKTHSAKALLMLGLLSAVWLPGAQLAWAQTAVEYYATGEEFAGPFPSWKNVKTDFGAKGDGVECLVTTVAGNAQITAASPVFTSTGVDGGKNIMMSACARSG